MTEMFSFLFSSETNPDIKIVRKDLSRANL